MPGGVPVDPFHFVDREQAERIADLFVGAERGILVAGSSPMPAVGFASIAADAGWPLIAEPLSGLRGSSALTAGQGLIGATPERELARSATTGGTTPPTGYKRSGAVEPSSMVARPSCLPYNRQQ